VSSSNYRLAEGWSVTRLERERSRHRLLRRDVNDRIAELTSDTNSDVTITLFCECGNEGCVRPTETTISEHAAMREEPNLWVVRRSTCSAFGCMIYSLGSIT
jgi:hypothetical protein